MAEIHYKNGTSWTKITYSDLGAAASNHNHDSAYLKLSGGTVTGNVLAKAAAINMTSAAPTSNQYSPHFSGVDTNGTRVGYMEAFRLTDNRCGATISAYRSISGTAYYNQMKLCLDAAGACSYTVTSPAAFRNMLGLGNTSGAVPVANGGTGATAKGTTLLSNIGVSSGTGDPPASGTAGTIYIKYA